MEKSKLAMKMSVLEGRKAKFGKDKCTYWKLEI